MRIASSIKSKYASTTIGGKPVLNLKQQYGFSDSENESEENDKVPKDDELKNPLK